MTDFFIMFEQWADADQAAARAESRLAYGLDMYCEGLGPAPSLKVIADAGRLRAVANGRLHRLWKLAGQARSCVLVI